MSTGGLRFVLGNSTWCRGLWPWQLVPVCGLLGGGLWSEGRVDTRATMIDQCTHQRVGNEVLVEGF